MWNGSTWPIDRTLSGAINLSRSRPENYGKEGVPRFSQSPSITEALLSDCLMSYPGYSLGKSYLSAGVSNRLGHTCCPNHFGDRLISVWTSLGARYHFGRPCCLGYGSGQVCLGAWRFPSASGGLPPGFYSLRGGWVIHPVPEALLIKGMPTGP